MNPQISWKGTNWVHLSFELKNKEPHKHLLPRVEWRICWTVTCRWWRIGGSPSRSSCRPTSARPTSRNRRTWTSRVPSLDLLYPPPRLSRSALRKSIFTQPSALLTLFIIVYRYVYDYWWHKGNFFASLHNIIASTELTWLLPPEQAVRVVVVTHGTDHIWTQGLDRQESIVVGGSALRSKKCTGWHIRLVKTYRWHWFESCVLMYKDLIIKRNFQINVNDRFLPTWCVTLYWNWEVTNI